MNNIITCLKPGVTDDGWTERVQVWRERERERERESDVVVERWVDK